MRQIPLSIISVLFLMLASVFASCRQVNDTLYMHYQDIADEGWDMTRPMSFGIAPADSSYLGKPMHLELHIRYKSAIPTGEFPLLVSVEDENGDLLNDTVRIRLFNKDGNPRDAHKFGISEHSITLLEGFPLRHDLSVSLTPLTPAPVTRGLLNAGIKLRVCLNLNRI